MIKTHHGCCVHVGSHHTACTADARVLIGQAIARLPMDAGPSFNRRTGLPSMLIRPPTVPRFARRSETFLGRSDACDLRFHCLGGFLSVNLA